MAGDYVRKVPGLSGLVLLSVLTLTASQCNDEKQHFASQDMIFVLPANVLPDNSEVTIGDTLWVTIATSDLIYEFNTKNRYRLPDFEFYQSIVVKKLIGKNSSFAEQFGAVADFHVVDASKAQPSLSTTFVSFKLFYDEPTQMYTIKMGFIPKRSGVYCFKFLGPDVNDFFDRYVNLGRNNNGLVIRPIFRGVWYPININGNNNYDLFADNCRALYYEAPDSIGYYLEYKGTFTFRVVE